MGLFDQLNQKLSIIEGAVLDEVHSANWERINGNSWRVVPTSPKQLQSLVNTWGHWRKQCSQLIDQKPTDSSSRILAAMNEVEHAVNFDLFHEGAEQTRWKVIFKYEGTFRVLREQVAELGRKHDEIRGFLESHQRQFDEFRNAFSGKWNVFIAINFDNSDEVRLIRNLLAEVEREAASVLKFHVAEDRRWLTELYSNLMFYMIACDAGLVFFTKANTVTKGVIHNPNVAFEFGFMSGLGKKCELIRQESVAAFTDVGGLLSSKYKNASETKEIVQNFLRQQLGLSSK